MNRILCLTALALVGCIGSVEPEPQPGPEGAWTPPPTVTAVGEPPSLCIGRADGAACPLGVPAECVTVDDEASPFFGERYCAALGGPCGIAPPPYGGCTCDLDCSVGACVHGYCFGDH